jgi:hypothetical protein
MTKDRARQELIFSRNEQEAVQAIPGLSADMSEAIASFAASVSKEMACMKRLLEAEHE